MAEGVLGRLGASSTFGRVAWGIVIGFVVLHAGTSFYYNHEKSLAQASQFAESVAERAVVLARHEHSPADFVEALGSHFGSVRFAAQPSPPPGRIWPHTEEIRGAVRTRLRAADFPRADQTKVFYSLYRGDVQLMLQLPLADGRWLEIQATRAGVTEGHSRMAVVWTTLMGLVVLMTVLWATRRITGHLPQFALAAERVGRNVQLPALPERGPREVRRVSRAFNAMQGRVTELLDERNAMLASLSHDVRTLVTRLGLRLEMMNSGEQSRGAEADIAAITTLLDDALAFARGDASEEANRAVDVPSMLQSLVDAENDAGGRDDLAVFEGDSQLTLMGQPGGLRRAFANLISNAIRYGGQARVTLSTNPDDVIVDVTDPGSGIPPADRVAVLRPYVRLESSRSRDTGGTGLGLAIVASVVRRHHGAIEFPETSDGFTIRIRLPRRVA